MPLFTNADPHCPNIEHDRTHLPAQVIANIVPFSIEIEPGESLTLEQPPEAGQFGCLRASDVGKAGTFALAR
jgi:hypothetical protein